MFARWIATVAALLLVCAQASAHVRSERATDLGTFAAHTEHALEIQRSAANASPGELPTNPKIAPPARASLENSASGKNALISDCHVWENWSPLKKCASGVHKYLYGNGNPGSFWDLDGFAAAPPCASTPAGCVSPEQLQQQQMLSDREATMVAGIDFEAPPQVRQEPEGPGMSASTEPIPKDGFEANAWRSRQMRYEGNQNSLALDDRVGNVVAVVCPWCTEKNELGIEQKVNPINRERLSTSEWEEAVQDLSEIASLPSAGSLRRAGTRARVLAEGERGTVKPIPAPGSDVPYSPRAIRAELEARYGARNVRSTTVPPSSGKNVRLAGRAHPDTGIVFDSRGFPIFDDIAAFDTRLPIAPFRKAGYTGQMRLATQDLQRAIEQGEVSASRFTDRQLEQIRAGAARIDGYTWHHHQDTGRMQLVPRQLHSDTGHVGSEAMGNGR